MNHLFWIGFEHERKSLEKAHHSLQNLYHWLGRSEAEFIRARYIQALEIRRERREDENSNDDLVLTAEINLQKSAPMDTLLWLPKDAIAFLRPIRINLIREAIRGGILLPARLFSDYAADFFNNDFRSLPGHMRAYHTAISGHMGVTDVTLRDSHGVILRQQDGKRPTQTQREEVRACLDELFSIIGGLSRLCRAGDLTIIHSNGKQLFQTPQTFGIHRKIYQAIALYVNGKSTRNGLDCLAHELAGHWLDHISLPSQRWINKILTREKALAKEVLSTSFLDACYCREGSIYAGLLNSMNPYPAKFLKALPSQYSPSEVWSRAVEQYIAERLWMRGIREQICTKPLKWYYQQPGYWDRGPWMFRMRKLVREGLQARLWMARRMNGLSQSRVRKPPPLYRNVFPWVDGMDLQFFGHYLAEQYLPRDFEG